MAHHEAGGGLNPSSPIYGRGNKSLSPQSASGFPELLNRWRKAPLALVERGGDLRGQVVANVTGENLKGIIREHVDPTATIMSDEHSAYVGLDREFAGHEAVGHGHGEYVRGKAYTNTLEGVFSLFKRQIVGAHHHISPEHLDRYWSEFTWKHNRRDYTEGEKMTMAIQGGEGKRLAYKDPRGQGK